MKSINKLISSLYSIFKEEFLANTGHSERQCGYADRTKGVCDAFYP